MVPVPVSLRPATAYRQDASFGLKSRAISGSPAITLRIAAWRVGAEICAPNKSVT